MLVIGLVGGIASGKSLVANCFEQLGAVVLNADRIGHEVLDEPEVIEKVVTFWGNRVLENGRVNRGTLARIVFAPTESATVDLEKLERITHPRIERRVRERLEELRQSPQLQAVVLDAPVMFKSNWDRWCDRIVFVDTDFDTRQFRARQRGWADDEISKRESRQMPLEEKRRRSTDIIDNSSSKQSTYEQAIQLWQAWGLTIPNQFDPTNIHFSD